MSNTLILNLRLRTQPYIKSIPTRVIGEVAIPHSCNLPKNVFYYCSNATCCHQSHAYTGYVPKMYGDILRPNEMVTSSGQYNYCLTNMIQTNPWSTHIAAHGICLYQIYQKKKIYLNLRFGAWTYVLSIPIGINGE